MKYELTALVNSLNDRFDINSIHWVLEYVNPYNPFLIDRTGRLTLGTTDQITKKSIRIKWAKRLYATNLLIVLL